MTHPNNFTIPVRFTFRPFRVEWNVCFAEIVGWTKEQRRDSTSGLLPAIRSKPLLAADDEVRVKIVIRSPNAAGGLRILGFDDYGLYELDVYRKSLPSDLIAPHEDARNASEIAGRTFPVLVSQPQEFNGYFLGSKPEAPRKNAWAMRDEFLHLENDIWGLRTFLNRWGIWWGQRGYNLSVLGEPRHFILIHPHCVWQLQDIYRRAIVGPARKWLRSGNFLNLIRNDTLPYFSIEASNCDEAIRATITIDHLSESTFGICKRNDCRRLFEFTTKQRRLYCTPHCAHVANVRKLRAQKKKAANRRGGQTNARG